jgi:hypothetical protein
MPVCSGSIREHKQSVWVIAQEAGYYGSLGAEQQPVSDEASVDDVKSAVLSP